MSNISRRRSTSRAAVVALGSLGITGSAVLLSAQAAAVPNVPNDVWVQCTEFSGPLPGPTGTVITDPLGGCSSRSGEGSGFTRRTVGQNDETLVWNGTFEGGKSLSLVNTGTAAPEPGTSCPEGQILQGVKGEIGPRQPMAGSPITATICINLATGSFSLAQGSVWTIHKVPGSPEDVNPPS